MNPTISRSRGDGATAPVQPSQWSRAWLWACRRFAAPALPSSPRWCSSTGSGEDVGGCSRIEQHPVLPWLDRDRMIDRCLAGAVHGALAASR